MFTKNRISPRQNKKVSIRRKGNQIKNSKQTNIAKPNTEYLTFPLWLKALLLLHNTSYLVCFATIAIMLTIYGMTVSAPLIWTSQFYKLRELQKDERQMTSTNETVKEELLMQSKKNDFGLTNPDLSKPPLILDNVNVKPIELEKNSPKKLLQPPSSVNPIAY